MFDQFISSLPVDKERVVKKYNDNILLITRWNIDYQEGLDLQKMAIDFVREHKEAAILIFCNHPHVYTLGKGLQKTQGKVIPGLVEFSESEMSRLSFPIHKIFRGGGITFHYPGQWIFYPILNITRNNWGLSKHFNWILDSVAGCLSDYFKVPNIVASVEKAGIWCNERKVGSIGVGTERFITSHGLALNLVFDAKMMNDLMRINPCGLRPDIYQSIDKVLGRNICVEEFHHAIIRKTNLLEQLL